MKILKDVFVGVTLVFFVGVAQANYSDDFDAGIPASWTEHDPIGGAAGGTYATFSNPAGAYRIEAAQSPNPGALGGARALSMREDHTFTDVTMSWDLVDWDDSVVQIFGGVARAKEVGLGTTDGYGFVYGPKSTGSGGLDLQRYDNEVPTDLTTTVSVSLDPTHDYRFTFTVVGSSLTGEVYDLTTGAASPIATISAADSTFSDGVTGLLVASASGTGDAIGDATFDNVSATVGQSYSDDFETGIPAAWMEYDPIGGAVGGTYATFSNPAGAYRIEAAQSPNPGALGGARALSIRSDYTFTDVTMSWDLVDWDDSVVQIFGGVARAKEVGLGTTDGYGFVYGPKSTGSGGLDLQRYDNEVPTDLTTTVSVSLDPTHDYRFVFSITGASLTGAVYDLTTGASAPVATISAVDGAFSTGETGLLVASASGTGDAIGDATFDNVSATDFSEPPLILIPADLWIETTPDTVVVGSSNLLAEATNALWVTYDLVGNNWSNIPPVYVGVTSTNWTLPAANAAAYYQIQTTAP